MKRHPAMLVCLLPLVTLASCQAGAKDAETAAVATSLAAVGENAPDFTLADAAGREHSLTDFAGKYVVLEWVNFGCPFVKKHYNSENMQALQSAYTEREVVWLSICSSGPGNQGYLEGKELTDLIAQHKSNATAYLIDADGKVGRMYEAKTTPHMFVIDPKGVLIYAGAIDDRPSTKLADVEGATNYVQLALDAALAGEEIELSATKSYGCSVKYAQ